MKKISSFMGRVNTIIQNTGVDITMEDRSDDFEDEVNILWFGRDGGEKGDGAKILQTICGFADQMEIVLSLVTPPALIPYYTKFGFVQDGPTIPVGTPMYRFYKED